MNQQKPSLTPSRVIAYAPSDPNRMASAAPVNPYVRLATKPAPSPAESHAVRRFENSRSGCVGNAHWDLPVYSGVDFIGVLTSSQSGSSHTSASTSSHAFDTGRANPTSRRPAGTSRATSAVAINTPRHDGTSREGRRLQ